MQENIKENVGKPVSKPSDIYEENYSFEEALEKTGKTLGNH